ncbi:MAG: ATP-binding cassette, subfamily bacterial CydC [Nocardioidaceae bacterium]|nr:ATP-binding cassette, subfamily bacterial CydC [Nocardioidaceae bacterium]
MTRRLLAGAGLGVLAQLCSVGLLLTSAWLIVRAAQHPPVMYLMVAIVSVRFFGIGRAVFRYAERLLTHDAALSLTVEARVTAYQELDRVAPAGLPRQRRGDIVNRIVADVDTVQDRLLRIRLPWIYALTSSACVIVLLAFISPIAAGILTAHVLACTVFVRCVVARLSPARRKNVAVLQGAVAADASVLVLASRDLIAYDAARGVGRTMGDSFRELATVQRSSAWIGGLGSAFILASTGGTIAALGLICSGVPAVVVGVLLLAPVALLEPLETLAECERLRPAVTAAGARLDELATVHPPIASPASPLPLAASSTLSVENLAIGWDRTIARDISLHLIRGDLIGVSGPSGVGKSTLAMTLAGLIEPKGGRVRLGGVDLANLEGTDIRTRIGVSSQDDVLFDTTIRENLRIADPRADDHAMGVALDRAGLGTFVRSLPRGLDTPVGEHGGRLSGGERQRLGLARLVLGGHAVLIFDEPTEHLDHAGAEALLDDVRLLADDHAVLVISHSPHVLDRCDRILQLHGLQSAVGAARPEMSHA